jgi:hypothetical protein
MANRTSRRSAELAVVSHVAGDTADDCAFDTSLASAGDKEGVLTLGRLIGLVLPVCIYRAKDKLIRVTTPSHFGSSAAG